SLCDGTTNAAALAVLQPSPPRTSDILSQEEGLAAPLRPSGFPSRAPPPTGDPCPPIQRSRTGLSSTARTKQRTRLSAPTLQWSSRAATSSCPQSTRPRSTPSPYPSRGRVDW